MILDVFIDGASVSVNIDKPHQPDLDAIYSRIERLAFSKGIAIDSMDVKGLIEKMIRGIAGCERGCPANAKYLVSTGYKSFKVEYVEGGILTAHAKTGNGVVLTFKMFPDF